MSQKIMIVGGGTGGHVYPALSMAEAFKKQNSDFDVHFVGTTKGIESRLVPEAGYKLHFVEIGRMNHNVSTKEKLFTLLCLPFAFLKSFFLLLKLRPKAVVGVGGYASVPVMLVAAIFGFKCYIWEPNAIPGLANRFLSKFVKNALLIFEEAKKHVKSKNVHIVGLPIRQDIEEQADNKHFDYKKTKLNLLIFGGSQGARAINEAVSEMVVSESKCLENFNVVHQTGQHDIKTVQNTYHENNKSLEVMAYINDMPEKLKWADIVIARSGASTLAELAAMGLPSVLIPYPLASDNHQQKNASAFEAVGAAKMLVQKQLTPVALWAQLEDFYNNREQLEKMSHSAKGFYKKAAAEQIVKLILQK